MSDGKWDAMRLAQKIAWRNRLFSLAKPPYRVIEYFAGAGYVTEAFWIKAASDIACYELDEKKVATLHAKFGDNPAVSITHADAFDRLDDSADYEVVDCDAYGIVIDMVSEILKRSQTEHKVIFFTDGTLAQEKAAKRAGQFEREIQLIGSDRDWVRSPDSNVYFGYVIQ